MSSGADAVGRVLQVVVLVAAALAVGFLAGMTRPRTGPAPVDHRSATPLDEPDAEAGAGR